MNCREFQDILLETTSTAEVESQPEVVSHLSSCDTCRKHLALEKKMQNGFAALAERQPPTALAEKVFSIPDQKPEPESIPFWQKFHLQFGFSLALAAVLLLVIIKPAPQQDFKQSQPSSVTAPADQDLLAMKPMKEAAKTETPLDSSAGTGETSKTPDQFAAHDETKTNTSFQLAANPQTVTGPEVRDEFNVPVPPATTRSSTESEPRESIPSKAAVTPMLREETRKPDPVAVAPASPVSLPKAPVAVEKISRKKEFVVASAKDSSTTLPTVVVGTPLQTKTLFEKKSAPIPEKSLQDKSSENRFDLAAAPRGATSEAAQSGIEPGKIMMMKIDNETDDSQMAGADSKAKGFASDGIVKAKKAETLVSQPGESHRDFRYDKIEKIIRDRQLALQEGPLDINEWVLGGVITVRERIALAPNPGTRWMVSRKNAQWQVHLAPENP